ADYCATLLREFDEQTPRPGTRGTIAAVQTGEYARLRGKSSLRLPAKVSSVEQSNSSIKFGERFMLKLFRRIEEGPNPELEISAYLTRQAYAHTPPLAGALEYRRGKEAAWTLGVLQAYVANRGDAWKYMLDRLQRFFTQQISAGSEAWEPAPVPTD